MPTWGAIKNVHLYLFFTFYSFKVTSKLTTMPRYNTHQRVTVNNASDYWANGLTDY